MNTAEIIQRCQTLHEDMNFTAVREWKAQDPSRKVIGYLPVYVPRELIHAAGMLALGISGGGDGMEVIHGDAYYQSYICRIPRSTVELGVSGRLDFVDGMLFPSICDVIRNLSGIWQIMFPNVYVKYIDVPQNYANHIGGEFWVHEMQDLRENLARIAGREITDEMLNDSIAVYNENRRSVRELYALRSAEPWKAPSSDVYLLMRAGLVLPVEEHTQLLKDYITAARAEDRPQRDNCRVVINGAFCEQPPLNLIKSIEMSGCYIVDDDFMLVHRWLLDDVPTDGDPLQELSKAFLHMSAATASKYEDREENKGRYLLQQIEKNAGEGVLFVAPSFCDPALLEQPMLVDRCKERGIPNIAFRYAENSGQMQPIREQAGTFADSIKLWS